MSFETENIEFKLQNTNELYKKVIALANTDGGVIYFDIDNIDDNYILIKNGIRDTIMPDVTKFVKYTIQDNKILKVTVEEGSQKPYYLKAKGLKPNGVFILQGTSFISATSDQIRTMIKESDGDVFESMRSVEQSLTFTSAKEAFKRYNIEFSKTKYCALGITIQNDELYSNLALIISDQCAHTTKVAVFADEVNTVFRDSKEFAGSIFEQLENTYAYLALCNKTSATFKGLERIERVDYPTEALREALLNALIHRDYSFSGSIIINVNDKEMEFISIGGLLPGLSTDDIRSGISQPRNKNLASIFHRLHLIESYGTGIRRIYSLYADCPKQPRIEVTSNTFKIILPNMNYAFNEFKELSITTQRQKILEYIDKNGQITDEEIQELLGVKKTRAFTLAKQMRDDGFIKAVGRGNDKRYWKI